MFDRQIQNFAGNWPAISGLVGGILYLIGRLFADVFYGKYGLTPEDLGINLPYLALRVLPLAALFGFIFIAFSGFAIYIVSWFTKPIALMARTVSVIQNAFS